MPIGTAHQLSGVLLRSNDQLVLRVDDGGCWRLSADLSARRLLGSRVDVVGVRAGFDLIDVERIGRHGEPLTRLRRTWWQLLLG